MVSGGVQPPSAVKRLVLDSFKGPLVYVVNIVYSLFKRMLFHMFNVKTDTLPK